MKYLMLMILILQVTLLASCTSMTLVTAIKKPHNKVIYVDGDKYLESTKKNSRLTLEAENLVRNGKRIRIRMSFLNLSDKPQMLNPSTIRVLRESKKDNFSTLSYSKLLKEVNDSQKKYAFFAVLGGVSNALSASGSAYNSSLTRIEQNQYATGVEKQLDNFTIKKIELKKTMLKRNTVPPGKEVSGFIVIDWPMLDLKEDYFLLSVKFANDRHQFRLKQLIFKKN